MSLPKGAQHPPFQARVASVAIITTVVVLLAACVSFMAQQWAVAQQDARRNYNTLAEVVATSTSDDMARNDRPEVIRTLAAAGAAHNLASLRLLDARGRVIAHFEPRQIRHSSRSAIESFRRPL